MGGEGAVQSKHATAMGHLSQKRRHATAKKNDGPSKIRPAASCLRSLREKVQARWAASLFSAAGSPAGKLPNSPRRGERKAQETVYLKQP
jgi:hypothetical protein